MGLNRHCVTFLNGDRRSCTYSVGYGSYATPEPKALARSDGELRPEIQDKYSRTVRMKCAFTTADQGRENEPVAYGSIVARDLFRAGSPGVGR